MIVGVRGVEMLEINGSNVGPRRGTSKSLGKTFV